MTQILQMLVFAAAIAGLIRFGFYRDKQEHSPKVDSEDPQQSIDFSGPNEHHHEHRGAAMSRLS